MCAQFDIQPTYYMFFQSSYNPAAAGSSGLMTVAGFHRMQYVGMPKMPQTTMFHVESPFLIGKTEHGAAVRFLNDKAGLLSNQTFHMQYAYRQKLNKGYLSGGVTLGFVSLAFQGDSVLDIESDYHDIKGDECIPATEKEAMTFDMGVGIYYTAPLWYMGASFNHVTYPKINWTETSVFSVYGVMTIVGGYNWKLPDGKFVIKPSSLIQTDFIAWSWALSVLLEYNQRFRGGLTWRLQDAVGVLLGMDVISGLSLGYAYELPTTRLIARSWGSHELYLSYSFDILRRKKMSKYKSIRIL